MNRLAEPTLAELPSRRDQIRSTPGLTHASRGVFALGLL
jgi:hypothetical protein